MIGGTFMKKYTIRKYYKVISSLIAFIFNSLGLVFAIIGVLHTQNPSANEKHVMYLLAISELFMVCAVIYSVVSIINSYRNKDAIGAKDTELMLHRLSNKAIFENQKAIITTYKDSSDQLTVLVKKYNEDQKNTVKLKDCIKGSRKNDEPLDDIEKLIEATVDNTQKNFEDSLVNHYNHFMVNILNLLKDNIKEYMLTKGCNADVSLAIKQIEKPVKYVDIDEKKKNIYTAYRDQRTYNSKKRTETWQKKFCIGKNSDFKNSIEKDYYIFNFMNRTFLEERLYLNENSNFYEKYNSGVTCAIFSCVKQERILYGFLACDSLLDKNIMKKCGKSPYDYNVANLMMATAHIIALYLERFLNVWEEYVMKNNKDYTISEVMVKRVQKTRYND